jgi:hypothetical protein
MLFQAYTALLGNFPPECSGLFGEEIRADIGLWLAIDGNGFPSFLLAMQPADLRSDIALRFVGVQFSRECSITLSNGQNSTGTFTIIRLEENDADLVRVFLRLLEEAFCGDDVPRTNRAIAERILELADLFRQIENSSKDMIGLWGELLIISQAQSSEAAARCWCLHKNSKYDFVCDAFVLEVKTTLKASRKHSFALEQLRPSTDLAVFIASIQLTVAHGGKAVFELVDGILDRLDDAELRKAFLSLCLIKGGVDLYKSTIKLQPLSRTAGIAYFASEDIPVPEVSVGAPISNVRFDVSLDALPELTGDDRTRLMNLSIQPSHG